LAVDLTSHTGEDCKPYATEIGLEEIRDPSNESRIIKMAVSYRKRSVVKVPLSIQGKLSKTLLSSSVAASAGAGTAAAAATAAAS
jgi:hypothetical protein